MGVRGLLKFLMKHPQARERVYLGSRASAIKYGSHGATRIPKLLCDFFSIIFWLLKEFHDAKVKTKDYQPYSYIYGGDLLEYEKRVVAFVHALQYLGIEPVFYVDGIKGSHIKGFNAKLKTSEKRHAEQMEKIFRCSRISEYNPCQEVETYQTWIPHTLVMLNLLMVLKSEGVRLVHCIGEADTYFAKDTASSNGDILGILTNDTDMVMMRGCRVILCHFFDRENVLGIRSAQSLNEKPSDVACCMLTPERLARELRIDQSDLKNLSVICGNDYTSGLNKIHDLHLTLELSWPILESAAKWLKDTPHEHLDQTPPFDGICKATSGEYKQAIDYTYQAYGASAGSDSDFDNCGGKDSPFFEVVLDGIREGRMTRQLLSIAANSIVWRGNVMEIIPTSKQMSWCINDALLPIRHIIYKLLGLCTVTEYGHTTTPQDVTQDLTQDLKCCTIPVEVLYPSSSLLPEVMKLTGLSKVCLLVTFLVKANQLKGCPIENFQTPITGATQPDLSVSKLLKPLVLCASLLFSYNLQSSSSIFSPEHTTDVFLVTSIMCCLALSPRNVLSRPSPEAIDIASGFACIIEHSYHLASLLGLFEEMPHPAKMYQTAAFIPFYHIAISKPADIKHQLCSNKLMAETYNAFYYITKELSSFRQLKRLLEEVYLTSKSDSNAILLQTLFRLVKAFMEAMADIEEAHKDNRLFVPDIPSTHPGGKHHHGKSMHLSFIQFSLL